MRGGGGGERDGGVGGFRPVDLRGVDDNRFLARRDQEARARHFAFGEQFGDAVIDLAALSCAGALLRARERLRKTAVVEWFEQIVERVNFERADGVAIVRGDED